MTNFIRGERWGLDIPLSQILTNPEFEAYLNANRPFNINIQQVSKTPILMDCLVARPGHSFVELDVTSLEPCVIAELSGSKTYKELFASGKPHDVYLFVAIRLLEMGAEIDAVYNIKNPTKESVGAAKKKFKHYRNMVKPIHLMSAYRAGARKVRRSLLLSDIDVTLEQTQQMLKDYWGPILFGDVLQWEKSLLREREDRGGYILNGLGRPFAIAEKKLKDIMNTNSQGTGHDLLDLWLSFVWKDIESRGIWERVWPAVDDFHDETVLESEDGVKEIVAECLLSGLKKLNEWLKPNIPLQGAVEITKDFTGFKSPDPVGWYEEKLGKLSAEGNTTPKKSPNSKKPKTSRASSRGESRIEAAKQ